MNKNQNRHYGSSSSWAKNVSSDENLKQKFDSITIQGSPISNLLIDHINVRVSTRQYT